MNSCSLIVVHVLSGENVVVRSITRSFSSSALKMECEPSSQETHHSDSQQGMIFLSLNIADLFWMKSIKLLGIRTESVVLAMHK